MRAATQSEPEASARVWESTHSAERFLIVKESRMADEKKRIVLTGATRGLGLALTERFIAQGHTVAGCGRSRAPPISERA